MSPQWLALLEPFILSQPIGHDKVPMFFWGPLNGPGVVRKIRKVASLRDNECLLATQPPILFFLNDLDPDGCLVADQLRACTKTLESTGADKQKSLIPNWRLTLQKKDINFCDGEVFSLDRGLLMGAKSATQG
jgi:hypothetical protein